MIKGIIFDMDGVIINSENIKANAWEQILTKYGVRGGGGWYKNNLGNPGKILAEKAIAEFSLPIDINSLFLDVHHHYLKELENSSNPIKTSIDFLKLIPKSKFKIALSSSMDKKTMLQQMNMNGVLNIFDSVTSGLDEIKKDKPNSDIYLATAKKLNILPKNCIVIEDTPPGVKSAKNAGMKCIGFINPMNGKQDLSEADIITNNLLKIDINEMSKL